MAGKMSAAGVLAPSWLMVLLLVVHYTGGAHAEVSRKLLEDVPASAETGGFKEVFDNSSAGAKPLRRELLNNGLNATPRMGWSTWNAYGININENLVKQAVDQVVALGLKDAGYTYINIDDGWNTVDRDANGNLKNDPSAFPSGMTAMGDYIHARGLKYGLYLDAGQFTCGRRAGSLGFELQDAQYLQAAGVDYLKYDSCAEGDVPPIRQRFAAMRDALAAQSRPIYFSTGYWGYPSSTCDRGDIANSWRTFYDIYGNIDRVFQTMDQNNMYPQCAGPTMGWNDPDYLVVGGLGTPDGRNDYVGERTQMSIWAIMKAPLIISIQLASIDATRLSILTNREVIAVNQDSLGKQAVRVSYVGTRQIWAGPLSGNRVVVALVNENGGASDTFGASWGQLQLTPGTTATARNLWTGEELGTVSGSVGPFTIEPHGTVLLVLTLSSGGISSPTPPMSSPCSPSYPYPKFPYETKCRDVVPSMPQPCNSPDGPGSFSICCPSTCGGLDTDNYSPICSGYPGTCTPGSTPAPPANTPSPPANTPSPPANTPSPPAPCTGGPTLLPPGSACSDGNAPNPCFASDGSRQACCPGACGPFAADGSPTCLGQSTTCPPAKTPSPPSNPTPAPTNPGPNPTPAPTNPGPNPTPAPTNPDPNPTPPCNAARTPLPPGSSCPGSAPNPCYFSDGSALICCATSCGAFASDGKTATCAGDSSTPCTPGTPATNPPATNPPGTNPPGTNPPATTPSPPAKTPPPTTPSGQCATYPYPKSSDGASCDANLPNTCYESSGSFFICCPLSCGAFLANGNPTCVGYPSNCTP